MPRADTVGYLKLYTTFAKFGELPSSRFSMHPAMDLSLMPWANRSGDPLQERPINSELGGLPSSDTGVPPTPGKVPD